MDTSSFPTVCPSCSTPLLPTMRFCPTCGREILQSLGIGKQVWIYFVSLLLPPLGLIWTWKYLRSSDEKRKRIGLIAAGLTILSFVLTLWWGVGLVNSVQQQLNSYSNLGL